jgi:membrane protein
MTPAGGQATTKARPLARVTAWFRTTELGRLGERSLRRLVDIEIFDRAMTLAAQAFSSILPIIIVLASFMPDRASELRDEIIDQLGIPASAQSVIESALGDREVTANEIGLLGVLFVLVSATSFSRALVRMYCRAWDVPRPSARTAWRWLAALLAIVLSLLIVRTTILALTGSRYEIAAIGIITLSVYTALWLYVPWLLLAARIPIRLLAPGAVISGFGLMVMGYASQIYMPLALTSSANRFGPIGVAFTYLSWLFAMAFVIVVATVVGHVVATDEGRLGRLVRGAAAVPSESAMR